MATRANDCMVPDLPLPSAGGGIINPADFRGQKLALFYCPEDPAEAEREIEAWRALADRFEDAGVWVLGVAHERLPDECLADKSGRHIAVARDSDERLRALLLPLLRSAGGEPPDVGAGAAFLFERWGCLDSAWGSPGRAQQVLEAARERP